MTTNDDTTPAAPPATLADHFMRHGWLLAAVWLVFLVFPILSIVGRDRFTATAKVASIALMVVFSVVYLHGFQVQHRAETDAREQLLDPGPTGRGGRLHFGLLLGLTVATYLLVDVPALGLVPFLVSFATFHFSWPVIWLVNALGLGTVVGLAVLEDGLGDVWFLIIITASVGAATMLIRLLENHQNEQTHLRTNLAVSDERNRVARDVHDVLGHSLTAVILKAELCQRLLEDVDPGDEQTRSRVEACREQLAELHTVSRGALAEIRSTVGGLRASDLADEVTVARTVLADAGVDLLVTGHPAEVAERHRPLLAWVVREAVTNVVRHAKASTCHIELQPEPGAVLLRVSDDGVGLPNGNGTAPGNGLRGLRERVETFGGELVVRSGSGTTLEVTV